MLMGIAHHRCLKGPNKAGGTGLIISLLLGAAVVVLPGCRDSTPASGPRVAASTIDASLGAAETFLDGQDLPKAEAILERLVDQAPEESRGHEMLGRLRAIRAAQIRDARGIEAARPFWSEAWQCYREAARLAPELAGLHHSAGEMAHNAGRLDDAAAHYEDAQAVDPTDMRPRIYRAQILIEQGHLSEARTVLEEARSLDPDEPMVHASLAGIALTEEDHEAALTAVREARSIDGDNLGLRVMEARVLREAGRPRDAVELLIALPERERGTEVVAAELAEGFLAAGEPMRAAACWQLCFQTSPHAPRAWRWAASAGHCCLDAGERAHARTWLLQAQTLSPGNPELEALEARLAEVPE